MNRRPQPTKKRKQTPTDYPAPRSIFVDVDGTLIIGGKINEPLVLWLSDRKFEGFELILWSLRGRQYAAVIAERWCLLWLFDAIISKPGQIVDDQGLKWLRNATVRTQHMKRGRQFAGK